MDLSLFRLLNNLAGHGWDWLFIFCASHVQYALGAVVVVYAVRPHRRIALLLAAFGSALIARLAVAPLIQLFVQRARPFVVLNDISPLITLRACEWYRSMPSGHTIFFFALAAAAYQYHRNLGRFLFGGAFLIGISRVIVGVHWPSDILVGALVGAGVGWAVVRFIPRLRKATSA